MTEYKVSFEEAEFVPDMEILSTLRGPHYCGSVYLGEIQPCLEYEGLKIGETYKVEFSEFTIKYFINHNGEIVVIDHNDRWGGVDWYKTGELIDGV